MLSVSVPVSDVDSGHSQRIDDGGQRRFNSEQATTFRRIVNGLRSTPHTLVDGRVVVDDWTSFLWILENASEVQNENVE